MQFEPRTIEADAALLTEARRSRDIRHGRMMAHDMPYLLDHDEGGGAARWESSEYTEAQAREAVRCYARWLLRCAEAAR
jgi:hypothetical protein